MMDRIKVKMLEGSRWEAEIGYIDGYSRDVHGYPVAAIALATEGMQRIIFAKNSDFKIILLKEAI